MTEADGEKVQQHTARSSQPFSVLELDEISAPWQQKYKKQKRKENKRKKIAYLLGLLVSCLHIIANISSIRSGHLMPISSKFWVTKNGYRRQKRKEKERGEGNVEMDRREGKIFA